MRALAGAACGVWWLTWFAPASGPSQKRHCAGSMSHSALGVIFSYEKALAQQWRSALATGSMSPLLTASRLPPTRHSLLQVRLDGRITTDFLSMEDLLDAKVSSASSSGGNTGSGEVAVDVERGGTPIRASIKVCASRAAALTRCATAGGGLWQDGRRPAGACLVPRASSAVCSAPLQSLCGPSTIHPSLLAAACPSHSPSARLPFK